MAPCSYVYIISIDGTEAENLHRTLDAVYNIELLCFFIYENGFEPKTQKFIDLFGKQLLKEFFSTFLSR